MIDEHAQAVLDLLDADNAAPALVFYDGKVPTGVIPPYVVVYFEEATPGFDFVGQSYEFGLRATCHCVGGNARAARMVADRVLAALQDVTPTVAGRACWPIRWDDGAPPTRDEATGSTVMDQIAVYLLRSVPA
jgi:hypothetical protein